MLDLIRAFSGQEAGGLDRLGKGEPSFQFSDLSFQQAGRVAPVSGFGFPVSGKARVVFCRPVLDAGFRLRVCLEKSH